MRYYSIVVEGWRVLANPEVSVALGSLDKKPTGFSIWFWIIAEKLASLKHLHKNWK